MIREVIVLVCGDASSHEIGLYCTIHLLWCCDDDVKVFNSTHYCTIGYFFIFKKKLILFKNFFNNIVAAAVFAVDLLEIDWTSLLDCCT